MDRSLNLILHPYTFIRRMQKIEHADVFYTRVLFQKTICMTGEEAGKVFYDKRYFMRQKAAPLNLRKTLFGDGAIQGLDGDEHLLRKQLFMSLVTPDSLERLASLTRKHWRTEFSRFSKGEEVKLFDELSKVLCRAVCEWLAMPLDQVDRRTAESLAMIDGGGGGPIRFLKGWLGRRSSERWVIQHLRKIRRGERPSGTSSFTYDFATFHDTKGRVLPEKVAAAELINVIRPTIAVARFLCYCALALQQFPQARPKNEDEKRFFFLEVKRFYPFFPAVTARVKEDFEWKGVHFRKGVRVLFDLYGTNHDPRSWVKPEEFLPERFRENTISSFAFVPQGGSEATTNHRCPGERIASRLMSLALDMFCEEMDYRVPEQDLSVSLKRAPTGPKSGVLITDVKVLGFS